MKIIVRLLMWLAICAQILIAQDIPRTLYVLNGLGQTISTMNLESKAIDNNISTVGSVPNRIYSHNNYVYVVNSVPDGITAIDPVRLMCAVAVGSI